MVDTTCTTSRFLRMGKGDALMALEAEHNYYVNDWMYLAPSITADSFSRLASQHAAYSAALREVGITTEWLHFYWAAHIHHALHVASGVRRVFDAGVDVTLARSAYEGRFCRTNRSVAHLLPAVRGAVWGGMQHALCPFRGRVRCPWASHRCAANAEEGSIATMYSTLR